MQLLFARSDSFNGQPDEPGLRKDQTPLVYPVSFRLS